MHKIVLFAAVILFVVWLALNFMRIIGDQNGIIRFVLGSLFSVLILLRRKERHAQGPSSRFPFIIHHSSFIISSLAIAGTLFAITGIILPVHQFHWLGLILILYACLRWALPEKFSRDIFLAVFLLYWIHPLPSQIFGKFELAMQFLSVKGAEWLLHCANVRVWADGMILRTGVQAFGVPEACSGMRTAVTVLLCVLGVGVLFRLKWYEIISFLVLGIFQVLFLNIIRISLMVFWAAGMPAAWAETFLHDTLGIFLLITILLVQFEISGWRLWRVRRRQREERQNKTGISAPFWNNVHALGWCGVLILLIAGTIAFAAYKKRPAHRAAMISGVVDKLAEDNLKSAEKAVATALYYSPDDDALHTKKARILVLSEKFDEAVLELDAFPEMSTYQTALKSMSLMRLGREEEAVALIEKLPESVKGVPAVAMVRAEYAARQDLPEIVSKNILIAAKEHWLTHRIRDLFAYLALHEQWQTIVDVDSRIVPYNKMAHALIAVHANIKVGNISGAASVLGKVLKVWPNEPRFLSSLFELAIARPGGEWEKLFADSLKRNLLNLNADRLATYINYSFNLNRPDLAWLAYLRLEKIDPEDPALFLSVARFGHKWFTFRKHHVGLSSVSKLMTVDMRSAYFLTRTMKPFRSFWERVPLVEELSMEDFESVQAKYLKLCLSHLRSRSRAGTITRRMELMYPATLALSGQHAGAHAKLNMIAEKYPEKKNSVLFWHAFFYDQQAEWQKSYEALFDYNSKVDYPDLTTELLQINACMNLNMGVSAMETVMRAREVFPDAYQLDIAEAAIWRAFGFNEQALFVLTNDQVDQNSGPAIQMLYETGRYKEAKRISRALNIHIVQDEEKKGKRAMVPPPAEFVLMKQWLAPLNDAQMDQKSKSSRQDMERSISSFIRDLNRLKSDWYAQRGQGRIANPDLWRAIGRNNEEQTEALYHLAMFFARQQKYGKAKEIIEEIVKINPASSMLYRVLVVLSDDKPVVVEYARKACPDDPDIWLAMLVVKGREGEKTELKIRNEIKQAIEEKKFSVGTMVRAGDFLFRKGFVDLAAMAAKDAEGRCRGLLSAHVLALRCALRKSDSDWALRSALKCIGHADDPSVFHRIIVDIKSAIMTSDSDLISSLEYLNAHFSDKPIWAERLGHAYFEKGEPGRSLSVIASVIDKGFKGIRVPYLLLAAEAARIEGNHSKAVNILELTYAMYPERVSVLNNFVYNLAQDRKTVARARKLLPTLLELGRDKSFAVFDTAAVVCFNSGETEQAKVHMKKALKLLVEDDYSALEIKLNWAGMLFRLGEYSQAKQQVELILSDSKCSVFVEQSARKLLREIKENDE
ncbi:archaeosortase/exosortase family protein [Verrucomicrobiota bacterium]